MKGEASPSVAKKNWYLKLRVLYHQLNYYSSFY